jgi:hypothetical protein
MNYKVYYVNQVKKNVQFGGGMKIYKGSYYQNGYGLGNVFKTLKKGVSWLLPILKTHALPALKNTAEILGKQLVQTASDIVTDKIDGVPLDESVKNRSLESINTLKKKVVNHLSGAGKLKKKRIKKDIFD